MEIKKLPTLPTLMKKKQVAAYARVSSGKDAMKKAIELLDEVKESIINAYELKTGLPRKDISKLMENETWMNARKAIELGFADGELTDEKKAVSDAAFAFSGKAVENALLNKLTAKYDRKPEPKSVPVNNTQPPRGRSVDDLMGRLLLIQH